MRKIFFVFFLLMSFVSFGQVTKSSISGKVKTNKGEALPGASVEIKHQPTGTKYFVNTAFDGSYSATSVKPGGPYVVKVTYVGYKPTEITEVNAPLGDNVVVNVVLQDELTSLQEIKVTVASRPSSKGKTGASQQFSTREINSVPIIGSRTVTAITKYNANAGSNGSFGGQDSRLNNFTIDGSIFNNGFGLGNEAQAGGRTGSTAISMDAIEQIQVTVAPFDVRQTGFTGSGVNAVTRSGTNQVEGSVYHSFRNNGKNYIGTKAGDVIVAPANFEEKIWGARVGAPIIKDKLFFFGNFETIDGTSPATTWSAAGSPYKGTQISDVSYTDLVNVSNLLNQAYNYQTGPFENYDATRNSKKFLTRIDWNINDNHKLTGRFIYHNSQSDELISNSNSLGNGSRRTVPASMSYKNSGYVGQDNTRSTVLEWDWKISNRWSNNFIAGYDKQIEDRMLQGGGIFPTIDIRTSSSNTATYISAGLDPFTPANKLNYSNLHFTDNLTATFGKHNLLFGANYERFQSNNVFYPGSNGVYVFNSLNDFYSLFKFGNGGNPTDALGNINPVEGYANGASIQGGFSAGNPNVISRFQYRYSLLPGGAEPLQQIKSNKIDLYVQDEFKPFENLKLTFGVRATAVNFENTAIENPIVKDYVFRNGEQFNTGKMPNTQYLFEPRFGFNLDVDGKSNTVVRGGTGVFTGKPPYVFLSNAIGNNGIMTNLISLSGDNLLASGYGFTNNPASMLKPEDIKSPTNFDLAFTDTSYKFPQVWKTTLAVDQKLPFGFRGTIESIFSKNINEVFYYNANLATPVGSISNGMDTRPFYGGTDNQARIYNNVDNAIVLSNSNKGYFYSTTFKLEYPYKKGLWGSLAYTHSEARDLMSAGSTAASSWQNVQSVNGNNNVGLTLSGNNTPNRIVGTLGYKIDYGKKWGGSSSISLGYIGEQAGVFSYTYNGDINGDRVNFNDLLFVPNKASDLRFVDLTQSVGGVRQVLYTAAEQAEAFDRFIDQDPYLSTRRGQYVERNSNVLPMLHRLDLSFTQDFSLRIAGKKNAFQFRADILNFTNLLNSSWGVSKRATARNILNVAEAPSASNNYRPGLTMAYQTDDYGKRFLAKDTFQNNASVFDVWQAQFTLRYIFGK